MNKQTIEWLREFISGGVSSVLENYWQCSVVPSDRGTVYSTSVWLFVPVFPSLSISVITWDVKADQSDYHGKVAQPLRCVRMNRISVTMEDWCTCVEIWNIKSPAVHHLGGSNSFIININSFSRFSIIEMMVYVFCLKYSDTGNKRMV